MKKLIAIPAAALLLLGLSGCSDWDVPAHGSVAEAKYIVACHDAGGTYIYGSDLPGTSYNGGCIFRYPNLPPKSGK